MAARWNEASIADMDAERRKFADEARYYREEIARLQYERMERETWSRSRRVYDFAKPVEYRSAYRLIETLSDWSHEKPEGRITLRIMTPGGDEIAGLAIVDFVLGLRARGTPVDTLVIGEGASMGSVLMQCGETRYVTRNAFILIHESRTFGEDAPMMEKLSDAKSRIRLGEMLEERSNALLAERSVFDSGELLAAHYGSSDWWLTAQEAIDHGFADAIW
jgi:ATP-dependent protease ClpP protease subunit